MPAAWNAESAEKPDTDKPVSQELAISPGVHGHVLMAVESRTVKAYDVRVGRPNHKSRFNVRVTGEVAESPRNH